MLLFDSLRFGSICRHTCLFFWEGGGGGGGGS